MIDFEAIIKQIKLSNINDLIKENFLLIPLIYVIESIVLLIRNIIFKIPYKFIPVLDFVIIFIYMIFFIIIYRIIEALYKDFIKEIHEKNFFKLIGIIMCILVILFSIFILLIYIIQNYKETLTCMFCYFVMLPLMSITIKNKREVVNIIFCATIVLMIPISIGGLGGDKVIFNKFKTNDYEKREEYIYYGNNEGLYQLVKDGKVFLIPIDSGYIEYI